MKSGPYLKLQLSGTILSDHSSSLIYSNGFVFVAARPSGHLSLAGLSRARSNVSFCAGPWPMLTGRFWSPKALDKMLGRGNYHQQRCRSSSSCHSLPPNLHLKKGWLSSLLQKSTTQLGPRATRSTGGVRIAGPNFIIIFHHKNGKTLKTFTIFQPIRGRIASESRWRPHNRPPSAASTYPTGKGGGRWQFRPHGTDPDDERGYPSWGQLPTQAPVPTYS